MSDSNETKVTDADSGEEKSERLACLETSHTRAREKMVNEFEVKKNEFAQALPKPVSTDFRFVETLYDKLIELIDSDIRSGLKERLDEWNIQEKLLRLEKILQEQNEDEENIAWRPTGNPREDQVAHDVNTLRNHVQDLDDSVLSELYKAISAQHLRIEQLQRIISDNNKEMEQSSSEKQKES